MKLASVITRPVRPLAIAIAAMAVAALLSVPVLAQSSDDSGLQSGQRWNDALARADTYARVRAPSDFGLSFHREQLGRIRKEAFRVRDAAQQRLVELEQVIVLLGPAPGAGAQPEPEETAKRRQTYDHQLAQTRTTLADAELALARVKALESDLAAAARQSLLDSVLARLPLPLSPEVLWTAASETLAEMKARVIAFDAWYRVIPDGEAGNWGLWWRFLILFIAALGLGWFARKAVLQKFGRDPADQEPSYARALVAAIADAVASGVIPALIIAGLMAFFARPGALVSGPPERMLEVFLGALLLLILIVAITRAVLAPELPQWRTIEVAPEKAHQITRIVVAIGVVYSVDIFFRLTSDDFPVSRELTSVGLTLMVLLQAGGMFVLSRPSLWVAQQPGESEETDSPATAVEGRFWPYVRGIIGFGAAVGIVAALLGYGVLGRFLVDRIVATLVVFALLFLVRGILREGVGQLTRTQFFRSRLGVNTENLRKVRFWARGTLDPVLVVSALLSCFPSGEFHEKR